ncbi:MAG TPA: bifunctional phosphopantothenoylcysteine decarboxylase/phosphopantothenate--cysteine ligase CoaBC [Gemmatimonadaceae bacterium]|nr:bifunctional phosphopantothenoylcysteine decarboxylase/phosphopantothenate--cysteine ligase CoaBC [Gemmatimonadaceae bacterium]
MVLGVTGGIASYKAAWLARRLVQAGAQVDVVLTRAALQFVGEITFEALTGRPVRTALLDPGHALDHIKLGREADVVVVAPATADFIARVVQGRADDLLSAIVLAAPGPVLFAPAMNDRMWTHPQTVANVARLREFGYTVVEPDTGELAWGEGVGPGRLPEPDVLLAHIARTLERQSFAGRRVVVTAGPTREAIDPVRFVSNRSSGKMGVAVAGAAWRRGADTILIAGPLGVDPPVGPAVVRVQTVAEMDQAVRAELPAADVLVMAAAPADFRPKRAADRKLKRVQGAEAAPVLELETTEDILAGSRHLRRAGAVVVGFALETEDLLANARAKLVSKDLDMIVVNDARQPGAGFEVDTNKVAILHRDGRSEDLPLLPKEEVAEAILDRVEALLHGR